MGDLGHLAETLMREINAIQAESLRLKLENETLEIANKRLKEMLEQRESWLEEILMHNIDGKRQYEIYKQLKKDEILQDE